MGSEWVQLRDIVSIKGGKRLPKGESLQLDPNSHPYIRVRDMGSKYIPREGLEFVPDTVFPKIKNYIVNENDVIISIVGTVGLVAVIDSFFDSASQTENCAKLSGLDALDAQYLYYCLVSPLGQREISVQTVGAVQPKLPLYGIENITIPWPLRSIRESIVDCLGGLDDKIALNRQINTTLESMAQALFKSWFVDFDPVIDNALAAGNEIPDALQKRAAARAARREALRQQTNETTGATDAASSELALPETGLSDQRLPSEIQQLFPDRFVFTEEMGWVPEGWEVKKLGDFSEKISKGTTPSKAVLEQATENISIPFIKVKDLDDFGEIKLDSLEVIPESVHIGALKRSVLQVNDVLFSIAGTIGRVAIVPSHLHNSNTNQAVAFVRPQKQSMGTYIKMLLRSDHIQGLVNSRVVQAVQANFSLTELAGIPVLDAGTPIFDQWHEQSKAWFSAIALNRDSSVCLSNLRDSLLPKLLSGQITLPEAEQQLAEVL